MPQLLRFTLAGPAPATAHQHHAGLNACVLDWIRAVRPDLSAAMHDDNAVGPATVSPLLPGGEPGVWAFEVGCLPDGLAALLVEGAARTDPRLALGRRDYRCVGVACVRDESWADLRTPPPGRLPDRWTLRVSTPAAQRPAHLPEDPPLTAVTPDAIGYFGSWLRRWQAWAPPEFAISESLLDVVARRVEITDFQGGVMGVTLGAGWEHRGFVGDVTFAARHGGRWSLLTDEALCCLTALTRLACYCGTGRSGMRGMGQTRLLAP